MCLWFIRPQFPFASGTYVLLPVSSTRSLLFFSALILPGVTPVYGCPGRGYFNLVGSSNHKFLFFFCVFHLFDVRSSQCDIVSLRFVIGPVTCPQDPPYMNLRFFGVYFGPYTVVFQL